MTIVNRTNDIFYCSEHENCVICLYIAIFDEYTFQAQVGFITSVFTSADDTNLIHVVRGSDNVSDGYKRNKNCHAPTSGPA